MQSTFRHFLFQRAANPTLISKSDGCAVCEINFSAPVGLCFVAFYVFRITAFDEIYYSRRKGVKIGMEVGIEFNKKLHDIGNSCYFKF